MISWEEALDIIKTRELLKLVRNEAQIAKYRAAKQEFEKTHGGTAQFVIAERLHWTGDKLKSSGDGLLENWDDIKLIVNDFSYDFSPGICHFIVWLKTPIPCGPDEFPTEDATRAIHRFLEDHFTKRCGVPPQDIAWFKNTVALQSIPSVSHFHVLVRNCTDELERKILERPDSKEGER